MSLHFNKNILEDARKLIKGGSISGLAIINTETAEITELFGSETDGLRALQSYDFKDENIYASTRIKLVDLVDGGSIVEV